MQNRTSSSLVHQPNLSGIAMVWWWPVLRLARWKHDPDVALLHSGTGGVILLVKGRPARNDR